jgi:hypothetical protein
LYQLIKTKAKNDMRATLKFKTNEQAEEFATAWSRATCGGHTVFKNQVHVYGIDDAGKDFIDNYIKQLNK